MKSLTTPEHPDVARALRTGYPRHIHTFECADCGESFSGDARLYNSDGDLVCGDCLRQRLWDNYDNHQLAEAFGISCVTVAEHFEHMGDL